MKKSKPRKIDEGGKTGSTRTKSRAAASTYNKSVERSILYMKYIFKITIRGRLVIDTDAKNAISKIFVCLSVCMFLIETKTTRRILTKLGTIILRTPGQVIVYLGIPTGTGISGKILLYEKSKPLKLDA